MDPMVKYSQILLWSGSYSTTAEWIFGFSGKISKNFFEELVLLLNLLPVRSAWGQLRVGFIIWSAMSDMLEMKGFFLALYTYMDYEHPLAPYH